MNLPQPTNFSYSSLVNEIEKGEIKIPQFQREFVWDLKMSANLIDSIVKGYPIGTFIFWKTKDRLRSIRNLGNLVLPEPHEGDSINYVLDGQQRLTSLFIAIKGLSISRIENKSEDFSEMYIDLSASDENQIVKTKYEILEINKNFIKVTDLLKGDFTLLASYPQEYHTKINSYKKNFESYNFSVILVKEVPIDIATEIFTRINIGGKSLTLFEIMVAKTYDSVRDFDLSEKYNSLIKELENVKYETISEATVLQTISILLIKDCTRKNILRLEKAKIIDIWETAIDSIKSTVDYFKSYYRIPVSRLLPYNALIIPFSYFFFKHKDKPLGFQQKYLEDFFWRCSISGRYSSAVESKLAQDILKIDSILEEKIPEYEWSVNPTPDFILNNGYFSTGRSFIKAILSIYSYHQPKSFVDNSIVNIDNAYLKIASSKNYHHFFPKAFLTKLSTRVSAKRVRLTLDGILGSTTS
jgi:hypothetical protein